MKRSVLFCMLNILCYTQYVLSSTTTRQAVNNIRNVIQNLKIQNIGILAKRVYFNEEQMMSLNDNFMNLRGQITNRPNKMKINTNNDLNLITERNVYEISSLLNCVVSCEYCDILLNITNTMKFNLDAGNAQIIQYSAYQTNTLKPAMKILQKMISTLAKLMTYEKNLQNKKYDVLKVLLSFYLYLDSDINKTLSDDKAEENAKDDIKKIILQINQHLYGFKIKYCLHPRDYINKTDKTVQLIELKVLAARVDNILYFQTSYDNFITSDQQKTKRIVNMFNCVIPYSSKIGHITFNGIIYKNVEEFYRKYIYNSFDVKFILKFEITIQTKILIICFQYFKHTLELSLNVVDIQKKKKFIDMLLNKLDKFILNFKNEQQSSFLINNMTIFKQKLIIASFYTADNDNISTTYFNGLLEIDGSDFQFLEFDLIKELGDDSTLDTCFKPLRGEVIYSKLHSDIINLYRQNQFFSHSTISDLATDYKYLYKQFDNVAKDKDEMCLLLNKLIVLMSDETVFHCYNASIKNANDTHKLMKNSVIQFKSILDTVIRTLVDLIEHYLNSKNIDVNRLLFFLIYNKDNNELFNMDAEMSMEHIGHLIKFQHIVINSLVSLSNTNNCPDINYSVEPINVTNGTMDFSKRPALQLIYSCKNYFEWINNAFFQSTFIKRAISFNYELYWNGVAKTFEQIQIRVKKNIYDLQDLKDYQCFIKNWLITPMYYLFYQITNKIIISKSKGSELNYPHFTLVLSEFVKSKYTTILSVSINDIILLFLRCIKYIDTKSDHNIINLRGILANEIDSLGVLVRSKENSDEYIEFDSKNPDTQFNSKSAAQIMLELSNYINSLQLILMTMKQL